MKFLAVVVLFSVLALAHGGGVTKEQMDAFLKVLADCKEKHQVGEETIKKLMTHELIPEAKCFGACILLDLKFMTSDNKMNMDMFMAGNKLFFENDPESFKKGEQVLNTCSPVTDADSCEASHKIHVCLKENREAVGLKLPF